MHNSPKPSLLVDTWFQKVTMATFAFLLASQMCTETKQPNITDVSSRHRVEVLPDEPNVHLGHKLHWVEGCFSH